MQLITNMFSHMSTIRVELISPGRETYYCDDCKVIFKAKCQQLSGFKWDFLLFFIKYYNKLNIIWFWAVCWTTQDILYFFKLCWALRNWSGQCFLTFYFII